MCDQPWRPLYVHLKIMCILLRSFKLFSFFIFVTCWLYGHLSAFLQLLFSENCTIYRYIFGLFMVEANSNLLLCCLVQFLSINLMSNSIRTIIWLAARSHLSSEIFPPVASCSKISRRLLL